MVKAPATGKVIAICDTVIDNQPGAIGLDYARVKGNLWMLSENYVVIDHENGEVSLLAHLQQVTIVVQEGQLVKQGQQLGKVGNSGSTLEPHLHYQLMNGTGSHAQPLPMYFTTIRRKTGNRTFVYKQTSLQTGEQIISGR
ncbi:M23 family metallopeptidase [Rhodocytophaga rosea]|uniref:M23 family metallopeptidase n=2 Tax=Rhodocytophaga rosea TaxID=2704465 RepID=A0A6C0GUK0_9BACT|nr:M23 family metallopeptidase [Rhodocytophaga rosea]QHT71901.1 M23 family metallopeptidase [Rhodocytophaga rosea]